MYSPVSRLLTALNLLQARPSITATELAERLEVNPRSVRRSWFQATSLDVDRRGSSGCDTGFA